MSLSALTNALQEALYWAREMNPAKVQEAMDRAQSALNNNNNPPVASGGHMPSQAER